MRILLLTHYYGPEPGAPQQRWSALARRFVAAGHELAVIAPAPHYPDGALSPEHTHLRPGTVATGPHGETVHRVRFRPYRDGVGSRLGDQLVAAADTVQVATRRFASARPDVVIATVPALPTLAAGTAVARALGTPLVLELRDAWPDLLGAAREWSVGADTPAAPARTRGARSAAHRGGVWAASGAITAAQRRCDLVVTTTASLATALEARGVRRTLVVRNFRHDVPGLPRHVPRPSDGSLHVLYAGTVGRAQGLTTAVQAAVTAAREGTDVRVRIVGAGAEVPVVSRLAQRLGAPVQVLPPVDRARMAQHYAWADTALVSLRDWSGLAHTIPSKLYEVMGLGLHVSAVVSGEAAELVWHTRAGHVSAPGDMRALADQWHHLAAHRDLLDVGDEAQQWSARHADADRLAEHYLRGLHGVVRA